MVDLLLGKKITQSGQWGDPKKLDFLSVAVLMAATLFFYAAKAESLYSTGLIQPSFSLIRF